MIIHFTSARTSVVKDIETLRKVVSVIHRSGYTLARDWIEPQYHILKSGTGSDINSEQIYTTNIDAIERSDLVIIEGTEKSFGLGFQVATALHKKKPVLLLTKRVSSASRGYLSRGIKDPLLTRKEYGDNDLEKIVGDFIKDNMIKNKDLRFNFVIDRQIYNHLRWRSFKSGKTKAEVVRDLLLKDLEDKKD